MEQRPASLLLSAQVDTTRSVTKSGSWKSIHAAGIDCMLNIHNYPLSRPRLHCSLMPCREISMVASMAVSCLAASCL